MALCLPQSLHQSAPLRVAPRVLADHRPVQVTCKAGGADASTPAPVPRICTLKDFSDSSIATPPASIPASIVPAVDIERMMSASSSHGAAISVESPKMDASSKLRQLLAETVATSEQAQDFETLSGRIAMVSVLSAPSLSNLYGECARG